MVCLKPHRLAALDLVSYIGQEHRRRRTLKGGGGPAPHTPACPGPSPRTRWTPARFHKVPVLKETVSLDSGFPVRFYEIRSALYYLYFLANYNSLLVVPKIFKTFVELLI